MRELFQRLVRMIRYMELQFHVECHHGVGIAHCSGRLVRGAALDDFKSRITQLEHLRVLILDLSEVEQLDAGGLGALLIVRRWARQHSIQMKLVNPSPFVRRILEATRLTAVFEISSLEEALCILEAQERPPQYAVA